MSESTQYEEKSSFTGTQNDFLDITKTIVAFANCDGGRLCLKSIYCDEALLDSARIDDFVNRWVSPRVSGITSDKSGDGSWLIAVSPSPSSPHLISHTGNYLMPNGKQKPAFHQGQIFVRHSSKSEPATADDVRGMLQGAVSRTLAALGEAISKSAVSVEEGGIPISSNGAALESIYELTNRARRRVMSLIMAIWMKALAVSA